ncbi:MAG: ABC transporter permease [Ignavibacteria bacterium]|jgi:putative ABC transport system permease protein
MFKNYLKIALRNIYRNKTFSFINIVGLAIGLAVSFSIIIYVVHELSYDKHNENYDRTYRIDSHWIDNDWRLPRTNYPLAEAIKNEIPGIEEAARIKNYSNVKLLRNQTEFNFDYNYFIDPSLLKIFTIPFLKGDINTALSNTNSIVLSENTARTIFGTTEVIGDYLTVQYDTNVVQVKVTGIIRDESQPSTIVPHSILPLELLFRINKIAKAGEENWIDIQAITTYLLLKERVDIRHLEKQIRLLNDDRTKDIENYVMNIDFHVVPLGDTYFETIRKNAPSNFPIIDKDMLTIYSVIAFSILLLACINYVLLSFAKSSIRNTEIGIRKVIGARRRDIAGQIIFESIITLLLSFPLTIFFIELIFPVIQDVVGREINNTFFTNIYFLLALVAITALIGVAAGSYIAFYLSVLKPVNIFKTKYSTSPNKFNLKRFLLCFQIVVFVILLVSALVLKSQMRYIYNKDLGYDTKNMVLIYCNAIEGREEAFKNSIVKHSAVTDYAFTLNTLPLPVMNKWKVSSEANPINKHIMLCPRLGMDYPRFSKMKLIKGEFPDKNNKECCVILNETAAKMLGDENIIGKNISLLGMVNRRVVGIVQDFNINSLKEEIMPVVMQLSNLNSYLALRITPGRTFEAMEYFSEKWSEFSEESISFQFIEDRIDYLYEEEIHFEKVIDFFTLVAIIVASMGLFGLVMFSTQQRTKEIGIRKVLGASITNILGMLSKEYVLLVITGTIIASPIAYYFMNKWLNNFVYKITIGPSIFILALAIALVITMLTIGIQAIKAATANPGESLRYE